jgi:dTDP-4-dehydrorhamnose reductase
MKKLLVTGASGFLGWNLSQLIQEDWRIIGTWKNNQNGIRNGLENIRLDLTNKDQVWKAFKEIKPDAVIHLAAASSTNFCEKNPEISRQINVYATQILTEFCQDLNLPFLFTSSGQVFDGLAEEYHEFDSPNSRNKYGIQKMEAESFIKENYPQSIICRVPVMFGKPSPTSQNFAFNWLKSWEKGDPIIAFYDETRSFLSGKKAAEALLFLLNERASGVFHVGGEEAMSRVKFAKRMIEILKIGDAQIIEKSQNEIEMAAYRPPKVVFRSQKILQLGFDLGRLNDQLRIAFT